MNRKQSQHHRPWVLASFRVAPDELRRWHEASKQADLSLSQALRRSMREFVRAQQQPGEQD
jgi:hypothetical protein